MALNIPYNSGGGIDIPAPNLTYPGDIDGANRISVAVPTTPALATALSLTGKWVVNYIEFDSMTSESTTVKLTIDDVVIWNNTFTSGAEIFLVGKDSIVEGASADKIYCQKNFLLEISKATDTGVTLRYQARPLK